MRTRNPEPILAALTAVLGTAATLLGLLLVDSSAAVAAPEAASMTRASASRATLESEHAGSHAPRELAVAIAPSHGAPPELPFGDHAHPEGERCGLGGARAEVPRDDPNFAPTEEHYRDVVAGEYGFLGELTVGGFRELSETDLWWTARLPSELPIAHLVAADENEWKVNGRLRADFSVLQELRNEFMFWRDRERSYASWREHETQADLRAAMDQQFTRVAAAAGARSRRLRDVQLALGRAGTSDALDLCPSHTGRCAAEQAAWERVWSVENDCERPEPKWPGAPRE